MPPTISEAATVFPAAWIDSPLYCVRKVEPQSRIVKRMMYTQKFVSAMIQTAGFRKTICFTSRL